MLWLPKDWKQMLAGSFALQIANQIADASVHTEVCANLIAAAIDLSASTEWRSTKPKFQELSNRSWKLKTAIYRFIPVIDDDSYFECVELSEKRNCPMFIVPAKYSYLFTSALQDASPPLRTCVFALDFFLSWRATLANAFAGLISCSYKIELICRYNARAALRDLPLIETPSVSSSDP